MRFDTRAIQPCTDPPETHARIVHESDEFEESQLSRRVAVFISQQPIISDRNAEFDVTKSAFRTTRL